MAQAVIMPRQGQSVESCIINQWHKKVGDKIAIGDILFSYETDKSAFDEPAQVEGTLLLILANEGDVVPCLENVCVIGNEGEDVSAFAASAEAAPAPAEEVKEEAPAAAPATAEATEVISADGRVKISPRAKALALKAGVDMTKVTATGPNGRIIERDINAALDAGHKANTAAVEDFLAGRIPMTLEETEPNFVAPVIEAPAKDDFLAYTEEPMSNVRKVIARTMHASLSEMAQLTLNASFDATKLLAYRDSLKRGSEAMGIGKITINDMILFAVSRTLLGYPMINANLVDGKIRKYAHANVCMAVDTDRGLLVPAIFGAETLTLSELAKQTKIKAEAARSGALSPDEMTNGSFTVSNLGSMGIESFTPVINPPQTAILGVCATTNKLKSDGTVYPAMGLSLTIDHRAVDGAPAAKFLKELCTNLENFDLLLAK